jgi:hypothetical protein
VREACGLGIRKASHTPRIGHAERR